MSKKVVSVEPKMTDWSKGAPPMVGEWNASIARNDLMRRWWNGKKWSNAYYYDDVSRAKRQLRRRLASKTTAMKIEWRGLAEKPDNFVKPKPLAAQHD